MFVNVYCENVVQYIVGAYIQYYSQYEVNNTGESII